MLGTLLKYFKPVSSKATRNERLQVVPLSSIARANELAVTEVLEQSERGPYVKSTGVQRYQIGKWAAEDGITAAIRYYKTKIPNLIISLKETTVRRL